MLHARVLVKRLHWVASWMLLASSCRVAVVLEVADALVLTGQGAAQGLLTEDAALPAAALLNTVVLPAGRLLDSKLPAAYMTGVALDAMGPVPVPPVPGLQAVSTMALISRKIILLTVEHMVHAAAQMTRPAALLIG